MDSSLKLSYYQANDDDGVGDGGTDDGAGDGDKDDVGILPSESLDATAPAITVQGVGLREALLGVTGTWLGCRTSETDTVSNRKALLVSAAGLIPCVRRCRFALERTANDLSQFSTGQ